MKIGVFDSGIGGLSVANAIGVALPKLEVIFRDDRQHMPYGDRVPDEIFGFIIPIFQQMIDDGCNVIIVACNTVSTTLIDRLRDRFSIPLIAIEPMVKPAAANTKTGIITVCATPATLASRRYAWLKRQYASEITVLEPDCSQWATMIERKHIDEQQIQNTIHAVLGQGADVIVLGCTHYHWIEAAIKQLVAGRAQVIQPETAIVARLQTVLAELAELA